MIAANPNTTRRVNILDPTTVPKETSELLFRAASAEIKNSGSEAKIESTRRVTAISDTPKALAIFLTPTNTRFEDSQRIIIKTTNKNNQIINP
jgi:hypothetical protein